MERATSSKKNRSRVANGSTFLPNGDGRSPWARLARDAFVELVNHCGGADHVSEPRRMMARRAATLEAELVHFEDGFAKTRAAGGEPDAAALDLYSRLSNTQRRLAETLGWDRTAREVVPSLAQYLNQRAVMPRDAFNSSADDVAPDAQQRVPGPPGHAVDVLDRETDDAGGPSFSNGGER